MKDILKMIKSLEQGQYIFQMEKSLQVVGLITLLKVMGFFMVKKEIIQKEHGKIIFYNELINLKKSSLI